MSNAITGPSAFQSTENGTPDGDSLPLDTSRSGVANLLANEADADTALARQAIADAVLRGDLEEAARLMADLRRRTTPLRMVGG